MTTRGQSRQPLEDVLEIAMWIMPVEFRGLDQTHDGGGAFPGG